MTKAHAKGSSDAISTRAFTLVEMMVSMAVLALMLAIVASITGQATKTVSRGSAQIDSFQAGRGGFDIITQTLAQATLNTYWDYDNANTPTRYTRMSDLHFLINAPGGSQAIYFQAPEACSSTTAYQQTRGLLNACGYYVKFDNDKDYRPAHITQDRWRYRLMQALQPTEDLTVFKNNSATWTTSLDSLAWPIAENVIALIAWPRTFYQDDPSGLGNQLTSNYRYDSRTGGGIQYAQLPPMVQITLIVIDESSAIRLANGSQPPSVIENALAGKFIDVSKFQSDLTALQNTLTAAKITCRTMTCPVTLRESKWSSTP